MILGLETLDGMYLSSKMTGGENEGRFRNQCCYIQKSFIAPQMQKYFASPGVPGERQEL